MSAARIANQRRREIYAQDLYVTFAFVLPLPPVSAALIPLALYIGDVRRQIFVMTASCCGISLRLFQQASPIAT